MLSWLTPQRWRQVIPSSDSTSREVPSAVQPIAEGDEKEVGENHNEVCDSKYDVEPLSLAVNEFEFRTPQRSPRRSSSDDSHQTQPSVTVSGVTVNQESIKFNKLVEALSAFKPTTPAPVQDSRKNLPKIEYSKLVNLSLTNLDEYMVCIYNLGYSRMWPTRFAQPTSSDLEEVWCGDGDGDNVRREAYLVILNTIPSSLKYLVRSVQSGDVLGLWKAILDRLLHITPDKKRTMITEWNQISMSNLKMPLDKFVSHLYVKANTLKRYGIEISDAEMLQVFVAGLTKDYDWFRCHQRMSTVTLTMAKATKICLDYAYDNDLMNSKETKPILNVVEASGNSKPKAVCRNFNSAKGCTRSPCAYKHEKLSAIGTSNNNASAGRKCWSCQSTKHMLDKCPKKDEYIKKRDEKKAAAAASDAAHVALVLPIYATVRSSTKPWILDGAASKHITTDEEELKDSKELNGSVVFTVGNDETMVPTHVGSVTFGNITLSEVYLCKECPVKLISESQLILKGVCVNKSSVSKMAHCLIKGTVIFVAKLNEQDGLFHMDQVIDGKVLKRCKAFITAVATPVLPVYQHILPVVDVPLPSDEEQIPGVSEVLQLESCVQVPFDGEVLMDHHRKIGHIDFANCYKDLNMTQGATPVCPDCSLHKSKRSKFVVETVSRASLPIYRLHADLSGRKKASLAGYRYYILIVDDYSRKKWVFNLKTKSEAFQKMKEFIMLVERSKVPLKVAKIRTDGGGEFVCEEFKIYCRENGIGREVSAPYCQYQNGVVERAMGIVNNMSLTLMSTANSPSYDWPFAVQCAVYLLNYSNPEVDGSDKTPNSVFDGVQRKVKFSGIFGCLAYAKVYIRGKQEPKARRVVFLGYSEVYKAVVVRDISSPSSSYREYYARDVKFDPSQFPYRHVTVPRPIVPPMDRQDLEEERKLKNDIKKSEEEQPSVFIDGNDDVSIPVVPVTDEVKEGEVESALEDKVFEDQGGIDEKHVDTEEGDSVLPLPQVALPDPPPHVSIRRNSSRIGRGTSEKALENIVNSSSAFAVTLQDRDPQSRKEAMCSDDKEQWLEGEAVELSDIQKRGVWILVPKFAGIKVLKNRFVYKRKRHPDNTVYQRKVRLVVKGFAQVKGIDYEDTFASMITHQSIKALFFLMTFYKLVFWKVDIRTFFLYGECLEDVYMEQPEGYLDGKFPGYVCKLLKTLYGMKQAMRYANNKLRGVLAKMNIFPIASDDNVYVRKIDCGIVYFGTFVDDGCLLASTEELAQEVVDGLAKDFEITVDKNPTTYLRFEIERDVDKRYFKMHQTNYTLQVLETFQMSDCKPKLTPYSSQKLTPPRLTVLDDSFQFQQLLGRLIWLTNTRPDIMQPVGVLCRYMGRYNQETWNAAKEVLRYLKNTSSFGIVFDIGPGQPPVHGQGVLLSAACDADWGGRIDDSKSTTGLTLSLNDVCIHAKSKVQNRPALSTAESETNAVEAVFKEVEWYRGLLMELFISVTKPVVTLQDNQTTIKLSNDCIAHQRTKYFRISQHYIRWCVANGYALLDYLQTNKMWCDALTKAIPFAALSTHLPRIMGPQTPLKVFSVFVARCKTMSRKRPPRTPPAVRIANLQLKSRNLSKSSHCPSLEAKCLHCSFYMEWVD